jgi:hypothetical protein
MSGSLWIGKIPGTTVAPRTNVFCGGGRCCRLIHGRRAVEIARRLLGVNIRAVFMMSGSKADGDKFQYFLFGPSPVRRNWPKRLQISLERHV